ncbi:MAG: energy-coupling factor transporter transmembrane component T family protein, partial [Clostridium sp.]
YIKVDSPIHRLTGATKLICFLLWAVASMITYDTRVLFLMFIISVVAFKMSKIQFKDVSFIVYFILFFLLLNNVLIFIFAPHQGESIYGTSHEVVKLIGPYSITLEQLFYQLNITLKYFSVIPMALLFMVATEPSEFASSLNKIGVSYRVAYSVSIALRYIPDIQREYQDISFAQQARGIDMSKKVSLFMRIKNSSAIIMPLIFSSLDKIDQISCAMELRGFGKMNKRSWYNEKSFSSYDYVAIFVIGIVLVISVYFVWKNGGRFYNPFV